MMKIKEQLRVWKRCHRDLPYKMDVKSTVSYLFYLNSKVYRALIYRFDSRLIFLILHVLSATNTKQDKSK